MEHGGSLSLVYCYTATNLQYMDPVGSGITAPGQPHMEWLGQILDTPYNTLGDLFAVVIVVERRNGRR